MPTVAILSGVEAVKVGATSSGFTPMVIESVVASGSIPFDAVTRNELEPDFVGVPDKTPSDLKFSPSGSDPSDTANVGAGEPDAAKAYEYGVPTVAVSLGAEAVNVGARSREITETLWLALLTT